MRWWSMRPRRRRVRESSRSTRSKPAFPPSSSRSGNMDPNHRDNMAFLRICSGRFERDMQVYSARLGKKIRMTRMHRLCPERETLEEAFAGDVVG